MKKKAKVTIGIALGIILVGVIGMNNDAQEVKQVDKPTKIVNVDSKPVKKPSTPKKKVSKENYEKITQGDALTGKGGSTYKQVVNMLGKPKTTSESEITLNGETTKTKICSWSTWDMKIITVSFTNDHVSSKTYMD